MIPTPTETLPKPLLMLFSSLLMLCSLAVAQPSSDTDNRARAIGLELRCPVCEGSSITESPSDFARSMLEEVKSQVKAGKSESEIINYFAGKYGNTVLLKPPFSGITLLVWILPVLFFILGAIVLIGYLRRSSRKSLETTDPVLLEQVRAQLAKSVQS